LREKKSPRYWVLGIGKPENQTQRTPVEIVQVVEIVEVVKIVKALQE
jgi:hypothetical protein